MASGMFAWVRGGMLAVLLAASPAVAGPALAVDMASPAPADAPSVSDEEPHLRLGQALRQEFKGFEEDVKRSAAERAHRVEGELKDRAVAKVEERVFGVAAPLAWWQCAVIAALMLAVVGILLGVLMLFLRIGPFGVAVVGTVVGSSASDHG